MPIVVQNPSEEIVGEGEEIPRKSGRMHNSSNFITGSDLLSVETVVNIDFIKQAVMIVERKQQQADKQKIWDYVACPYPQGHLSDETNVFFNHEHINDVMFKGFESEGELALRHKLFGRSSEDNT